MPDLPIPPRPPTPQILLHRLPDRSDDAAENMRRPSKYIVLIMAPTAVAGKLQIARSVADALSCPLYQGDSMHESSAKAASLGTSRAAPPPGAGGGPEDPSGPVTAAVTRPSGPNEARYQRMWLSKMTRTGLLFPEESRPANEGFSGFGGASSTSTSRRGSASSISSVSSNPAHSAGVASSVGSLASSFSQHPAPPATSAFPPGGPSASGHGVVFALSEEERRRRANPALMVLTHPNLDPWHKKAIRSAVGDYGIGVIFIPLFREDGEEEEEEEDLPILRPLDPTTMTSFPISFGTSAKKPAARGTLDEEMKLSIDINAEIRDQTDEIIEGVRDMMGIDE